MITIKRRVLSQLCHRSQHMNRIFVGFVVITALMVMTACGGEVVTPQPTMDMSPTHTPSSITTATPRVTATAPLLPPAPTATPTVTPTPIFHIVQEGDTLGAIAFQYGVSVQALQAANGIENPQFLQINQRLIIPTGEAEGEVLPGLLLPTPTPLPVTIQGVVLYETPVGSLWCLGEILNTSEVMLTSAQVRVVLLDASSERLIEATAFAATDFIPPGERSPFGVLFTTPPSGWANPYVTIVRSDAIAAVADTYVPMTVTDVVGRPVETQFQVEGMVQNADPGRAAGDVSVLVTTYDTEGRVTGFRRGSVKVEGALEAGATAPFTVLLNFHGEVPADFNVISVGRIPNE
ncbi:MAG TPA: LysM domain-containing protein [Chloroflexi bacterium]|nr:LysM domain-containing protein [Chloroflexota bacterium]